MMVISSPISDTKGRVVGSYLDGSQVTNIQDQNLPDIVNVPGKDTVLYINPKTGVFTQEYEDRPLTESEKLDQSEQEQASMLLALVIGGLM